MLPKVLIAIVVVALTGIFIFKIFSQPPSSPILNSSTINNSGPKFQTYNSDQMGISFDYDPAYQVTEDTEQAYSIRGNGDFRKNFTGYVRYEPPMFVAAVALTNKGSIDDAPLTIWEFDNPENISIDNWYKKYWYYPFMWGEFSSDRKSEVEPKLEASVSGHLTAGNVVSYQDKSPVYTYISAENKMYLIRRFTKPEDKLATKAFNSLKIKTIQP
ncbi:hypothetical protein A2631_01795 [Candidatus Daviesbacteria bacterium RIFCSPHIGHO2_01_FULL_44_29]|uniref:Uncharacterized protein n=1 Tax=Candidatus Daviesbacteria bacterium RIFCSPHIGHO2_02_FULL_43_12 TaxID=1797776 RepID=A0A1F5KJN4_9BACT|nr:MAG: hypothetical protein A2631_01795 [Candidatus Daviesbacteria bacterium RIFCSPHIGHO2_01_FULL_44_29]OGE39023.1 MAG: hypothetical protein A3E86_00285 [Candidatus Daviesbacteria bacterium RIFCSPHIGHO2_12_FULL_47_45]OGE41133.1 MAG: hypothetical protein A3D25_01190 [Candidatus Daviesbacteria bacterium RIFCSPHIGHO2_02_FULL_43_12]OGE69332.1 MAG: hypothetical protein A3B55_02930 [Candidatus Daviesbacteria bacterium RIFCSPLOWO2_01_FULL_43_15]